MRITRSRPIWIGSPSSLPRSGTHRCPSSQQLDRQHHEELHQTDEERLRSREHRAKGAEAALDRRRQHHEEQRYARGVELTVEHAMRAHLARYPGREEGRSTADERDQMDEVPADESVEAHHGRGAGRRLARHAGSSIAHGGALRARRRSAERPRRRSSCSPARRAGYRLRIKQASSVRPRNSRSCRRSDPPGSPTRSGRPCSRSSPWS